MIGHMPPDPDDVTLLFYNTTLIASTLTLSWRMGSQHLTQKEPFAFCVAVTTMCQAPFRERGRGFQHGPCSEHVC